MFPTFISVGNAVSNTSKNAIKGAASAVANTATKVLSTDLTKDNQTSAVGSPLTGKMTLGM